MHTHLYPCLWRRRPDCPFR